MRAFECPPSYRNAALQWHNSWKLDLSLKEGAVLTDTVVQSLVGASPHPLRSLWKLFLLRVMIFTEKV